MSFRKRRRLVLPEDVIPGWYLLVLGAVFVTTGIALALYTLVSTISGD